MGAIVPQGAGKMPTGAEKVEPGGHFHVIISARLALVPQTAISGSGGVLGEVWRSTLCGHVTEATTRYSFNQWNG
jgi:hypothetical protein